MQIFFIVGAQKSGTTWLQKSLNSIEGIHCLGEGHFIDKLLIPLVKPLQEYNQMMQIVHERVYEGVGFYKGVPDDEFFSVMHSWILNIMLRTAKAPRESIIALGDKTPAHSFHMPTLQQLFPSARFIHMLRDGRDVTVSSLRHRERILAKLPDQDREPTNLNREAPQLLSKWAEFTRAVIKSENAGIPVHTVRYESMLSDGFLSLRGCVDHLLPENSINDEQLRVAVQTNSFQTMSGGREPGSIDNSNFLRRGQIGSWRDELLPGVQDSFKPDDRNLLDKLGYAT